MVRREEHPRRESEEGVWSNRNAYVGATYE
jgi:hypothetical protein